MAARIAALEAEVEGLREGIERYCNIHQRAYICEHALAKKGVPL